MKKMIFIGIWAFAFVACTNTKAIADSEKLMRGSWTVTDVSISGVNEKSVMVNVFDEASLKCYEGSSWELVQNNASGTYTLGSGSDCPQQTNKIKWFITEEGGQSYFNFKRIGDERPKNVVDGYKLRITSNTGSSIALVQDLLFDGKPINIHYTFQKNQ